MGLFSRFFGSFEPQNIDVPGLGTLTSTKHGVWEGHITLPGHDAPIPLTIGGAPQPPTEAMRAFLDAIQERFEAVEAELARTLFVDIDPMDDGSTPEQVFAQMTLLGVHIPADVSRDVDWELGYTHAQDDGGHLFTVHMRAWKHQGFAMDG